jgi:hypothetical protein
MKAEAEARSMKAGPPAEAVSVIVNLRLIQRERARNAIFCLWLWCLRAARQKAGAAEDSEWDRPRKHLSA